MASGHGGFMSLCPFRKYRPRASACFDLLSKDLDPRNIQYQVARALPDYDSVHQPFQQNA